MSTSSPPLPKSGLAYAVTRPIARERLAEIAFVLATVVALVPLNPGTVGPGLDPSWQQVLHVGAERGMQFGSDLVFTYGPFGFAHVRAYWPGLFGLTLFYWSVIAFGVCHACISLMRRSQANRWIVWPALFLGVQVAGLYAADVAPLFVLLLLVWYAYAGPASLAGLAGLCAIVGFIGLAKLTSQMAGGLAVVGAVTIFCARGQWRHAAVAIAAFTLAALLGWLAAGQRLGGIVPYAVNGLDIVTGYYDGMSVARAAGEKYPFAAVAVLALARPFYWAARTRDAPLLVACVFTSVLLALAFRQGFTRHDSDHAIIALGFLALLVATTALYAPPVHARLDALYCAALLVAAFLAVLHGLKVHFGHDAAMVANKILLNPVAVAESIPDLVSGAAARRRRHENAMAGIRRGHPLPPLQGTVDIYSFDQAAVFAHGLKWNPRPVFQSYSAYTPRLARLNAAHVSGPSAPDHLLFAAQPIDRRLPSLEDGASWVPILERYDLRTAGESLLLDRRAVPRKSSTRHLGTYRGNGWVELPLSGGLRTASFRLERAAGLDLESFIKGPPITYIELRLRGEEPVPSYRFIPRAAEAPFLFSPAVFDTAQFAQLFSACGTPSSRDVRAVRILDGDRREIAFSVDLHAVDIAADPPAKSCP